MKYMIDIVNQFESKLKNIGGEKVYSAREIMKIFGYDKWERFLGAINRAKNDIADIEKQNENFFFIVDKETGGRPKEDVLLTLGACYLVLKKCDDRKENVQILKQYMNDLLKEKAQQPVKKKRLFYYDFLFGVGLASFIIASFVFYFYNYTSFLQSDVNSNLVFDVVTKKEFQQQIQKQEKVFQNYDEQIQQNQEIQEQQKQPIITEMLDTYESDMYGYVLGMQLQNGLKRYSLDQYNSFDQEFNYRTNFAKSLTGSHLIQAYFELGNFQAYKDSCSLLSPKFCLSGGKSNFSDFGNYWKNTVNGYDIIDVKEVKTGENQKIYCVKYVYQLKNDLNKGVLTEVFNFTTQLKNGYEQIVGRYCESIDKSGKNIACPYKLENYYCDDLK